MLTRHFSIHPVNLFQDGTSELSPQPSVLSTSLYAGVDVGRRRARTVVTIIEKSGSTHIIRAILRMENISLPDQQKRLDQILSIPNLRLLKIDMTGLGLGLFEYTQQKFGSRIQGIDFSKCATHKFATHNSELKTSVRFPEHLATQLLQTFEDRAIHCPIDNEFRDDLRKPERLVSPSGRVSIAATTDASGHADHFWSLALALDAANETQLPPIQITVVKRPWRRLFFNTWRNGLSF